MPFGSDQWMYASGDFYPHKLEQSVRLGDNAYFERTPSVAGNLKTWTWSGWVKRGNIGTFQNIFGVNTYSTNNWLYIHFRPDNRLQINDSQSGVDIVQLYTTQVFREVSAWYHLVVTFDTTQATPSDRVKIYVNGTRITQFDVSTYPAQNQDASVNTTNVHRIGNWDTSRYFDGYMAEVNFIDGQALDPTEFGEWKSDIWIPRKYTGSYGTNGYHLDFDNAGFLGKDTSTVLGDELISNGTFDNGTTDWIPNNGATLGISEGRLSVATLAGAGAYQQVSVEAGKTYSVQSRQWLGANSGLRVGVEYVLGNRDGAESGPNNQAGEFRFDFTSTITGTVYVHCFIQGNGEAYFDDISFREVVSVGNDWDDVTTIDGNALIEQRDAMLDGPTNSFCTLNPVAHGGTTTTASAISEGNLKSTHSVAAKWQFTNGTVPVSSGKWYYEAQVATRPMGNATQNYNIGFYDVSKMEFGSDPTIYNVGHYGFPGNLTYGPEGGTGKIFVDTSKTIYGNLAASEGDIYMFALDLDNDKFWVGLNGTWMASGNPSTGANPSASGFAVENGAARTWVSHQSAYSYSGYPQAVFIHNYGQDSSFAGTKTAQGNTDANGIGDFHYEVPSDFLALCTSNLPDPVVDPNKDESPQDHFNPVLWNGDGGSHSITGVGFQPDLVWIKNRSAAVLHMWCDAVRGKDANGYYRLYSDLTNAEGGGSSTNGVTSLNADGFTVGTTGSAVNAAGNSYVAWNWKAGGTGVTNNVGGTTSTVSANEDLGISIVTWTGNSTATSTVGTGLSSSKPLDMVIIRQRDAVKEWQVAHRFSGQGSNFAYHMRLDDNSALSGVAPYNMGTQSSTNGDRIYLSTESRVQGALYIAYAFQSAEGFSKFGSYTGNGNADGPFIHTGFRPAFVMIKRTDAIENWHMQDTTRSSYNWAPATVYANLSNVETATTAFEQDYLSNGFKLRTTNGGFNTSGANYIYMAFAEQPFKYANAR